MTKRPIWIDQALVPGPHMALVTTAAQYRAALRRFGISDDDPWIRPGSDACTTAFTTAAGKLLCVVSIDVAACEAMEPIDVAALLAHEAVHVWQRIADVIGGDLGRELPAYAVQNISAGLMRAYERATSSFVLAREPVA